MPRHLVTLKQLATARPWITERFARRLVADRKVPFYKVSGKLLFDLEEVDALAECGRVEATR